MKRNFCFLVVFILSCLIFGTSAIAASLVVNDVSPLQNVGVYERGNEVNFRLTISKNEIENNGYFSIVDIDGKTVKSEGFKVPANAEVYDLNLGTFSPGWYRLYIYDVNKALAYGKYAAFSVVEPYSTRKNAYSPFAADHAGIEWIKDSGVMNDYAKALSLAGIDLVRERAYMSADSKTYETNRAQTKAYSDNGIEALNVWAKPQDYTHDTNLFDIYNMQKGFAEEFKDTVTAWEVINEPDTIGNLTPDVYQGYFKAAALGIYDASPYAVKSFGGLCVPTPFFREAIMANGVLEYSDIINVHTHTNSTSSVYNALGASLLNAGKTLSVVYSGEAKPMWVTESGIRLDTDANSDLLENCYKTQAKYVITSSIESLARGTDKHFYFLTRHFIENGKEFGIFHQDNMPYPAYSSLATLTYHLGEGSYKGDLKLLPDSVRGYVFDAGKYDAIVLWNTQEKTDYVQIRTSEDAEVISLLGANDVRKYSSHHKKVNLPVTSSPVIVKLANRADEDDYYKRSYPKAEESTKTRPSGTVIMPVWHDMEILANSYVADAGEEYNVTLYVYNFDPKPINGTISVKTTDGFLDGDTTCSYSAEANSRIALEFKFTLKDNAAPGGEERICFANENGATATSYFTISADASQIQDKNKNVIDGVGQKANWTLENTGNCTKYNDYFGNTARFRTVFSGVISRYSFPKFEVEKGFFADTTGMIFDIDVTESTGEEKLMARVWTENGGSFRTSGIALEDGTFIFPWSKFGQYFGGEIFLDPADIIRFSIGFETTIDGTTDYKIKNLCSYTLSNSKSAESVRIDGVMNGKSYMKGRCPDAMVTYPEDADIKIYLNFQPYEYSQDAGVAYVDLDALEGGAYNLIAAYQDEFGKQIYEKVSFYIKEKNWEKGTFF